jgi:alkylated DNA repair dioxygenase AlkB
MMQTELFERGLRTLVDDASGRITYAPDTVDAVTAARWFRTLSESMEWRSERRRMYDRDVDVPRLVTGFRFDDGLPPDPLPAARALVAAACGVEFNSVGLNWYRGGGDSVAPHNDHIDEIVPGFPVALLSLGSTRLMTIRSKTRPRRTFDLDLEPGSLLVMSYETQLHYDHGIPKTAASIGGRISLAFRVRTTKLTRAEKARARAVPDA